MTAPAELLVNYDGDSDVLYLALGRPVPASTDEDDDGLLVRYALTDGQVCGVTIMGYKHWRRDLGHLAELVGNHLHMKPTTVAQVLSAH